MSEVRVNKLSPRSGTTVTLGDSGDTITIPSGVTLANSGTIDNLNASNLTSGTVPSARVSGAYTGITQTGTLTSFASTGIDDNATSTAVTIDSSQRVGIGISSPTSPLHIKSASNPKFHVITASPTAGYNAGFLVSAGNSAAPSSRTVTLALDADGGDGTGSDNFTIKKIGGSPGNVELTQEGSANIVFKTADTERMRIDSSGRVGIGTSSVDSLAAFQIENGESYFVMKDAQQMGIKLYGDDTNVIYSYDKTADSFSGGITFGHADGTTIFYTGGFNERMRIDSSGRLAINTTSPDTGAIQTILHDGNSTYGLSLASVNSSGTQYHQRFLRGGTGGTMAGYITSNSATTIAVNNASDERLKENIQNSGSAIQDIKNIQVRQFDWKDGIDTHRDFGFVAQELINVVPEAVTRGTDTLDANGKPVQSWGVDYSHIVPRLVKVCQEQQNKIEELEARITALETNNP